jgi:hypothetical protein
LATCPPPDYVILQLIRPLSLSLSLSFCLSLSLALSLCLSLSLSISLARSLAVESRDFAAQLSRPVKKTEDKQVAPVIPRTAYCSVCKVQYFGPKMQCPMCNTSGVGKNNVVGSSHTDTQHSGVEPKLLHQVVCRTPHGRGLQKGSNVSALRTATSKPCSRS